MSAQQATTGSIVGTVVDSSGELLPGATVTVSGPALMGERTATTDPKGEYRFPALDPGVYKLVFNAAGFGTQTKEGITISVGFTATIPVTMTVASASQSITVSSESPVVDVQSSKVTNDVSSQVLLDLPNKADYTSVLNITPGVQLNHPDVGGSGAIAWAYGPRYGILGQDRGDIEGMNATESGIAGSDAMFTDQHAFEEMAVTVVANNAEMNQPGSLNQMVVKSGSNEFHGHISYLWEDKIWETTNISPQQLALGVIGSANVPAVDTNRINFLSDFNASAGGYIIKNKLWWFGDYRYEDFKVNFENLIGTQVSSLPVYMAKFNYNLSQNNKIIGFWQEAIKYQNPGLYTTSIFPTSAGQNERWADIAWKTEWDSIITPNLLLQVRVGDFIEHGQYIGNDQANDQYTDQSLNFFIGSDGDNHSDHNRLQLNGSLTYYKSGWWGTHNFKFGGEVYRETDWSITDHLNNISLTINNLAPAKVTIYAPPDKNYNDIRDFGLYAEDTWKPFSRLTLNLGIRFDQYLPYVPAQGLPSGLQVSTISRINGPLFNNPAPRIGAAYTLTRDGKTVLKASFGQFYEDPFYSLASTINPNSATSTTYAWTPSTYPTTTLDGYTVPVFVPGSQGAVLSTTGANLNGSQSVTVAPNCPQTSATNPCPSIPALKNTYLLQATTYVEREVAKNFGVRTGFVFNTWRNPYGEVNINEPYSGFTTPVTVTDPVTGKQFTAYNFTNTGALPAPRQVIENLPLSQAGGTYYNWEVSATKRMAGRWSLMASYVKTWAQENPLVAWSGGNPSSSSSPFNVPTVLNPNTFINTSNGMNDYTNWTAKFTGTIRTWKGIEFLPTYRLQSGAPFARTFTANLNYNSAVVIKAEPWGTERLPTIDIFDVRTQKSFTFKERWKLGVYFDVYNIFNNNATQTATESSGASFLRPTTITGPRIASLGAKFDF